VSAVLAAAVLVTAAGVCGVAGVRVANAATVPPGGKGPVGWDSYRRLDQLPYLTPGVQTLQSSSFDHAGGNADSVSGPAGCLAGSQPGACVLAQDSGPGEIDAMWFTWDLAAAVQPGRITVELDGTTPVDRPLTELLAGAQGAPFVYPLVASGGQQATPPGEVSPVNAASGGAYVNVPMTYTRSMRVTLQNPTYYHVTYRHFPDTDGVRTFDPTDHAQDVIDMLRSAGQRDPKPARSDATTRGVAVRVPAGATTDLETLTGPGTVTELRLRLPDVVGTGIADYGGPNPLRPRSTADDGRAFGAGGHSQFTVAVDPANQGVRLWRRLETSVGGQVAHVSVDGVAAGDWAPLPATPGQQWADESLTVPAARTAGKSQITVRTDFASSTLDFNEFRYSVESLVDGVWARTDTVDPGPAHGADERTHAYTITGQTWEGQRSLSYPAPSGSAVAASADELAKLRLRIMFDGQSTVDAPVGEFFGSGLGENPVRSLFFTMETGADGWYVTWWPMPFRQSATVSLVNGSGRDLPGIEVRVTSTPDPAWGQDLGPAARAGYFTAESHRGATAAGRDWLLADRSGRGKFVGVSQTMYGPSCCWYLEGDERVYVDGSASPSLHGTGTEDFYEAGWYFANGQFSVALAGETGHDRPGAADNRSAYRLMLADAVDYHTGLRFGIEHGAVDDVAATYGSTAYLYTQSTAAAVRTDTVEPGDPASRAAHAYTEAGGATQADLRSTYEGDNDNVPVDDRLRTTTGELSMRLALAQGNGGALLRRAGDQLGAGQAATVLVDGHEIGRWIQPAANGTSRWKVDTFPLPAADTTGKSAVTLTLRPDPGGWSAARYQLDSLVAPVTDTAAPGAPVARAEAGVVHANRVSWTPATDDVGVVAYRVYWSDTAAAPPDPTRLLTTTPGTEFRDPAHPANTTRWYRVVAVDAAGHAGPASAAVSATVRKRTVSDVNGDGMDDAVVFTGGTQADVFVSTSTGSAFPRKGWLWDGDFAGGTQVPFTGDVDGDGRADVISFGRDTAGEVDVALSTGDPGATPGVPGGFGPRQVWQTGFATGTALPAIGDFDGDGRTDIAAFTRGDDHRVFVALSTGTRFAPATVWHGHFAVGTEVPAVGDFDGDGRDDIVTFTRGDDHKAYVALSDGTRFVGDGWLWSGTFAYGSEIPAVGDVDGDGRDDAVTFTRGSAGDVFVSRSNGSRFTDTGLRWHDQFALGTETPGVGDFNGDGKADIVSFTQGTTADVYVSRSDGSAFIDTAWLWNDDFARAGETPRPSTA
jgi:hypothetical protein